MESVVLDSGTPAVVARGTAGARGLVVVPDIGGLRPLFSDMASSMASTHGWSVAVFEPFPGQVLTTMDERFAAVPDLEDDRVLGDAALCASLLGTGPVAIMGFCMGGMYAYKAASTGVFDRAVSFYGMIRLPVAWRGPGQGEPLAMLAAEGTCPVLSIVGGHDPYTPPEDVAELGKFGPLIRVVTFPEADHGFVHDPSRPSHRADDAAVAWQEVESFLG